MAFSIDLRKRVIAAVDEGMHITDVAKLFKVGRNAIYDWLKLRQESDSLAPKSGYQNGHSHKITDWEKFTEFAKENQHLTSLKMAIEWEKLTNVRISDITIQRALKKIGYTSKKNFWLHRSECR